MTLPSPQQTQGEMVTCGYDIMLMSPVTSSVGK